MKLLGDISLMVSILLFVVTFIYAKEKTDVEITDREEEQEDDIPRVRIKVFRGPTEEENGERFAPWGFWIKQPSN